MWPTHYIPNQERVEGTPPPRYYLTTPLYPLEIVEEIASSQGTPVAGFQPSLDAEEQLQSTAAPVSGIIKSILVSTSVLPDEIWSDGAVVSGVLVERLIRINAEIENLTSSGMPLSGNIGDPLVRYDNWPLGFDAEDIESAGLPISGALT